MTSPTLQFDSCSPTCRKLMGFGYFLLVFWSFFTIANEYTILPSFLPYTKDAVLLAGLLLSGLLKQGLSFLLKEPALLIFYTILLAFYPATLFAIGIEYDSTISVYKYFQPLLAIIVAVNMQRLSHYTLDDWLKWFYYGSFFLIMLNFIGYFVPEKFLLSYSNKAYPSRIVMGQPTPIAYVISIAFLYSIYILPFTLKQAFLSLILLLGVLVIVPGTTIAALSFILFFTFIFHKWLHQGNPLRFKIFLLSSIVLTLVLIYLFTSDNTSIRFFVMLLELKVKATLGMTSDPSLGARESRYAYVLQYLNPLQWLGTGLNSYTYYTKQLITQSTNLEQGFKAILVNFGLLGLLIYLSYFVKQFYIIFRYGKNTPYGLFHLSVLSNYLLHHFTLDAPYFYPMVIPTFFACEYCKNKYYKPPVPHNKIY